MEKVKRDPTDEDARMRLANLLRRMSHEEKPECPYDNWLENCWGPWRKKLEKAALMAARLDATSPERIPLKCGSRIDISRRGYVLRMTYRSGEQEAYFFTRKEAEQTVQMMEELGLDE